jgi:hypothetical protein
VSLDFARDRDLIGTAMTRIPSSLSKDAPDASGARLPR